MDDSPPPLSRVYPGQVEQPAQFLNIDQLAEQLDCTPDNALALVRRIGPRGVVRTVDRRFLIPTSVVEQLRAASAPGQ